MTREEIIAAHPLVEYCEKLGLTLKPRGQEYECLCPLHDEDTPSFSINPDKNALPLLWLRRRRSVIDLHMALYVASIGEAMGELSNGGLDCSSIASSSSSPSAERSESASWPGFR